MPLSDDLLETLDGLQAALIEDEADDVPEGWFTTAEYAESKKCSDQHAGKALNKLVAAGALKCESFRIGVKGRLRQVKHYGVVD